MRWLGPPVLRQTQRKPASICDAGSSALDIDGVQGRTGRRLPSEDRVSRRPRRWPARSAANRLLPAVPRLTPLLTRAAGSPPRLSPWWSRRCGTAVKCELDQSVSGAWTSGAPSRTCSGKPNWMRRPGQAWPLSASSEIWGLASVVGASRDRTRAGGCCHACRQSSGCRDT